MLQQASSQETLEHGFESLDQLLGFFQRRWPRYSNNQIAESLGVSASTLSRMKANQRISLNSLLKVLSNFDESIDLNKVLKGSLSEYLVELKRVNQKNANNTLASKTLNHYIKLEKFREIIIHAATPNGTTESEILDLYGKTGVSRLEVLLEAGALKYDSNKRIITDNEKLKFDPEINKLLMVNCVETFYKPEMYGTGLNFGSIQTGSINKEKASAKIREVLSRAYSDISDIISDEENKGSDNMFITLCYDNLSMEGKEKLQ